MTCLSEEEFFIFSCFKRAIKDKIRANKKKIVEMNLIDFLCVVLRMENLCMRRKLNFSFFIQKQWEN